MRKNTFRNIAIIAHVDHGKTTLVDGLLKQSGTFDARLKVADRVMDSMDLEKERGITITAKNTAIHYRDIKINILDTPGHADFGGEVERSLNLVDGALLLVDASEGPLPQTRFVLKKALEKNLTIILVINKIDRADARAEEVINETYDLFIDLGANEKQIEFPIIYTNAREGLAYTSMEDVIEGKSSGLTPLFETIIDKIEGPVADDQAKPQFLITNLGYDSFVGQLAIGRLNQGVLEINKPYSVCGQDGIVGGQRFSTLYTFKGLEKISVDKVESGDIIAVAGLKNITIGDTVSSQEDPVALPRIKIDEPTVSMLFYVNNSPFAGKEGTFLTTRHLSERLYKETLSNVSLQVLPTDRADVFEVRGRGELQMAVLVETMRREGYELMVSKPRVITHEENGKKMEPMEKLYLDIPEDKVGIITEKLSSRKGRMTQIKPLGAGRTFLEFSIPSRGLIGYRSQFLTDTQGSGIMNKIFDGYAPWMGRITQRNNGALVADRQGKVTTYACQTLADRGEFMVPVGTEVYEGMVVGERNKSDDMVINIVREKKLTNMRASGSDATVVLRPHIKMSLDQCIEFIAEDELVEITPASVRMRKMELDAGKRIAQQRRDRD